MNVQKGQLLFKLNTFEIKKRKSCPMIKKLLFISLLIYSTIPAQVYNVDAPVALNIINQVDDTVWIFINIDIYDIPSFYTRNYKNILKHLRKRSTQQYNYIKTHLDAAMQNINPLYSTAYGSAPHIIGITRRALSWSHLLRASCYQQNIISTADRYQITIPSATPEIPETNRYIELNTNILYIDNNECASCIAQYIIDAQIPCRGIIYIDMNHHATNTCVTELQQRMPHIEIIGLCVQNEFFEQQTIALQPFESYLEQLNTQIAQDTPQQKINRIIQEINNQKDKFDLLGQSCQQD